MIVFDFFAGTKSSTKAFEDAGDIVISFDNDDKFDVTEKINIFDLTSEYLIERYGHPDFIWASPPCTAFSIASIGHHWLPNRKPKTDYAKTSIKLVHHVRNLIEELNPTLGFIIENPRGMLRKLSILEGIERKTVTYCQYGDDRMKPTDLWTNINWKPRPMCKNGDSCHESAPRGSRAGTQGRKNSVLKSMVPYDISKEIRETIILSK